MSRVLYAEDDADIARLVEFCLELQGLQVETVPDGDRVMERLCADPRPDVLILDVMMPGKSGIELLDEIRARPEFDGLPVLVLSALAREEERQRIRRARASAFLTKPFECDELAAIVLDLAERAARPAESAP